MLQLTNLFLLITAGGDVPAEAEFNRWILRVIVIGLVVGVTGALILFAAFRSFGKAKARGGEAIPVALLVALVVFLIVCSAILLRISLIKG